MTVSRSAVSDLPIVVLAPAPEDAIISKGASLAAASREINRRDGGDGYTRDLLRGNPTGRGAVAELAVAIAAPAPQGAVFGDCARLIHSQLDRIKFHRSGDGNGAQSVSRRPVAYLSVFVRSPA